jgi:site-specific DNA-methyltransferase (adenine-specific)
MRSALSNYRLKWDVKIPLDKLWVQYKRIIKDSGAVLLFCSQPFTTEVILSNKKDYRYNWYWIKNNASGFAFAKYQPMRCLEDICVFYKNMPTYHPIGLREVNLIKKNTDTGRDWIYKKEHFMKVFIQKMTGYPRNVLFFDNDVVSNINQFHNTQKPVKLLEYFIKTYTDFGQTILDNCMGSGSTGVACVNTGRNFIGIELEETMFYTAAARIKEAEQLNKSNLFDIQTMNGDKPELNGGGQPPGASFNEGGMNGF